MEAPSPRAAPVTRTDLPFSRGLVMSCPSEVVVKLLMMIYDTRGRQMQFIMMNH